MRLSLTHVFPCTPLEFFDYLDDPELDAVQARESNMTRELVERRTNPDGTRFKKVRCKPNRTVPGFLRPFIGADGLVYFQVQEADPAKGLLRWSVETPAFGERMKVGGTTKVEPHPDGCRRTIDGEVTIDVRFVGGKIEAFIAEDVKKSYEKTAKAMADFIRSKKKP